MCVFSASICHYKGWVCNAALTSTNNSKHILMTVLSKLWIKCVTQHIRMWRSESIEAFIRLRSLIASWQNKLLIRYSCSEPHKVHFRTIRLLSLSHSHSSFGKIDIFVHFYRIFHHFDWWWNSICCDADALCSVDDAKAISKCSPGMIGIGTILCNANTTTPIVYCY